MANINRDNQGGNQGGDQGSQQSGGSKNESYSGDFEDSRMDPNHEDYDPNWRPGPVGAVEDPENDGRLKENRETGRTKGTTEHSGLAPHVDKSTKGSINNQDEGGGQFSGSGSSNNQNNQGGGNNQGGSNR